MNETQYLLVKLGEEAAEIAQATGKALIFGLDDEYKGETNRESIVKEINDLLAIVVMLENRSVIEGIGNQQAINNKIEKVELYMDYSEKCGILKTGVNND